MEVHHRRLSSSTTAFLIPKLPPAYLLRALHSLSYVIAAVSPPPSPPSLFKRSLISLIRKCGILSFIFEEILRSPSSMLDSLSNSVILSFEELFVVLLKIRVLIKDCSIGSSKIWLLMQAELITNCFHELTRDLRTLLEMLPKNELNLSEDVDELREFLINCCNNHKNLIDLADDELRLTVLLLLDSIKHGLVPDTSQLGETFVRLGLSDSARCREEIEFLQDEFHRQSDEKLRSDVVALVGVVRYAKCVLFGASTPSLAERARWNSSSELNAPREFQCPINLDLMTDPVVVATGQTYDRASITIWIESGRNTCPKMGQTLAHTNLIPNRALKSLIAMWCRKNRVPYLAVEDKEGPNGVFPNKIYLEATKMTVSFLLSKLASCLDLDNELSLGSVEGINGLVYELRVLAKTDSDSRPCIGEAGGIPLLVLLLGRDHPNLQVNAVTTILNLSILEANKSRIMEMDGALDRVVEVLRTGSTWEAKANAAATVFSLAGVGAYRKKLGKKSRVVKGLLELARVGPRRCKRDALVTILTLAGDREVAGRLVACGVIDTLKEITGELPEEAMTVLETVVKKGGLLDFAAASDMIGTLVAVLRSGTGRAKEHAVATLVIICRKGGAEVVADLAKDLTIEIVISELMGNGTARAKRKAASLMRILRRWSAALEGEVLGEFSATMGTFIVHIVES